MILEQLIESRRDGRHTVTLCTLWPEGRARSIRQKTLVTLQWQDLQYVCILCNTKSSAMLQFCMVTCCGVSFVYTESDISVWSYRGWLICDMRPPVWEGWVGGVGWREGAWAWACTGCTAVLVFVTRRRAAVESGPELLRVVGSRALLPRGQQWVETGSGRILLLLLCYLSFI